MDFIILQLSDGIAGLHNKYQVSRRLATSLVESLLPTSPLPPIYFPLHTYPPPLLTYSTHLQPASALPKNGGEKCDCLAGLRLKPIAIIYCQHLNLPSCSLAYPPPTHSPCKNKTIIHVECRLGAKI